MRCESRAPRRWRLALFVVLLAALASAWQPHDPHAIDLDRALAGPSLLHPLGTDHLGRDLLSRLAAGSGRTLVVVGSALGVGAVLGVALGLVAALLDGAARRLLLDQASLLLVVPRLLLALVLTALCGLSPITASLALALATAVHYTLLTATLAEAVMREPFWLAARSLGGGRLAGARRHLLPALAPVLLAHLGAEAARIVVAYSELTFIGLGADSSAPDWGAMIWDYRLYLLHSPRLMVAPLAAIAALALVLHLALDPAEPRVLRPARRSPEP